MYVCPPLAHIYVCLYIYIYVYIYIYICIIVRLHGPTLRTLGGFFFICSKCHVLSVGKILKQRVLSVRMEILENILSSKCMFVTIQLFFVILQSFYRYFFYFTAIVLLFYSYFLLFYRYFFVILRLFFVVLQFFLLFCSYLFGKNRAITKN